LAAAVFGLDVAFAPVFSFFALTAGLAGAGLPDPASVDGLAFGLAWASTAGGLPPSVPVAA
jgi:hypothetical protein